MKKIQFLRNDTVYTPSNSGTALQTAKNAIMSLSDISDGEIVLARYQESSNEDIKTLLCIYYNGSTETGWTFIGGLRAEIEETEETIAQALSDLDERVTENTSAIDSMSDLSDRMTQAESDIDELGEIIEENEEITASALADLDIRLVNETTEREELEQVVEDNELVTARALTELRRQIAELEEQPPIEYTETDPVFKASPAHGITSNDITNWNSKTSNVGTVTGVKMNNGTAATPDSNGIVDLGTVITSETQLSKGSTTGGGNAVTDITVNDHQITLTKGSTFLTSHQSIKTINSNSLVGTGNVEIIAVPSFTSADNGKILGVVNGQLAWVTPTTIYTGSGTPSGSQGNDGDIYLQTN